MNIIQKAIDRWFTVTPTPNYELLHQHIQKNIKYIAEAKDHKGRPIVSEGSATKAYMNIAMKVLFRDDKGRIQVKYLKAMEELIATIYREEEIVWDE